jgi:chaperone BCS1
MNKEILIDSLSLQEEILEYSTWKLYTNDNIPEKVKLDYLYMKKIKDGKIVLNFFSVSEEDEETKFLKNFNEIRPIKPEEVAFQLGEGIHKIPVLDGIVEIDYKWSDKIYSIGHDLCQHKKMYLRGPENLICQFLSDMNEYHKNNDKNSEFIKVYSPTGKGYWDRLCKNNKRQLQTVFINQKQEIINDLDEFIESEEDYQTFGHPYKRNYLFHGTPGNGKTSFINAIASRYNLNIYMISFSSNINDEVFKKLVSTIPRNGLLVLEDIDNLFDENEKRNISMSTVLNIMDGIARKTRIISLMTTNNFYRLSDVFKRPGRIDVIVEFKKADEECFLEMASFMCSYHKKEQTEELVEKARNFYKLISYMEPSRALVQKYLFENRKKTPDEIFSKKMLEKFKEISNIYSTVTPNKINLYG